MAYGDFNGDGNVTPEERARAYHVYSESEKSEANTGVSHTRSGSDPYRNEIKIPSGPKKKDTDTIIGLVVVLFILFETALIQVMPGAGIILLLIVGVGWLCSR